MGRVEVDNDILKKYPFDRFFISERIPIDKNGNFWYPNPYPDNGQLFDSFKVPPSVPLNQWESFHTDNHSNIWLKDISGNLYKYDMQQKRISEKSLITLDYISLNNFNQDEDGTVWLHGRHGIDKLLKKRNYFDQYLYDPNAKKEGYPKLTGGITVYPITETDDGRIHVLSNTNKLHSFNPHQKPVEASTEIIGLKNDRKIVKLYRTLTTMLPALGNRIWINNSQTMYLHDPGTFEFTSYPLPKSFSNLKKVSVGTRALSLEMDEDGKIWYVLRDHLVAFDSRSKEYSANMTSIFEKGIIGIQEGERWICSNTTLSKFNGDGEVIKEFTIPEIIAPEREIKIFDVVPHDDKVWIATRNGLLEFDKNLEQFKLYTTKDGLSSNIVYTILSHEDYLWMGTHFGLSRFNRLTKEFRNYTTKDGLTHNEFNRGAALKSKDGKLNFGGFNGVNAFYPEVLDSAARLVPSNLVLTKFSKIDENLDSLITYHTYQLKETETIEIFHGDKSFTFHFALLSFLNPAANIYSYYLAGFELDWKYGKNTSFVNYPQLPPGEYIFRVKAKDSLGNPGKNELAIPIIVYGPWWSTWWARSLFILLILTGIFGYIQWQTISLKRQKTVLEKTVKERTIELNAQKERAERSEKFKEQFLANMSHEIRTPMHAISGMTNILLRNRTLKHQQKFLEAIQQNSGNLLVILNDILDLSKIEAGKIEIENIPINPVYVIDNVIQIMRIKAEEKGLALDSSIDQNLPEFIYGDPTRLSQILLNLIGNAIKFTEKGRVDLKIISLNDKLQFEVKDTGIGIPANKLDTIFGKFNQVNESITRKYGGTGLGLNITKELVDLQKGTIWVESKENVGSSFFFELPLTPVEANEVLEKQVTEEQLKEMGTAISGLNILLVEDNDFNVMVATDDLTYYIPEVKIGFAKNGNLAIEEFEEGDYDLILMDIQMPELSGYEATRAIRKLEKEEAHIPIIAMTANLLKSEIDLCYEAGMDSYIPKPYKIEQLIGIIYSEMKKPKL